MMRNSTNYFANPKVEITKDGEAVDANKLKFLNEILTLLTCAENCYRNGNHVCLGNICNLLAFIAILMKEYIITLRIYSVAAQMLMMLKQWQLAADMYVRLNNCATTIDIDVKVKMYSYKQLGICFMKLKEY